jgi:hypothetical protein
LLVRRAPAPRSSLAFNRSAPVCLRCCASSQVAGSILGEHCREHSVCANAAWKHCCEASPRDHPQSCGGRELAPRVFAGSIRKSNRGGLCITRQSTRTHNSRRRLRRKCWWSGHFYVMSHPGVFEVGRILPSVAPCTAWCAAAVVLGSSSCLPWRVVPSLRRNRVGRRSTETTPLITSALLQAVATRKREATVSGVLRQASAVPAHACESVENFAVCEQAGGSAQRRVVGALAHCQRRGDAT